MKNIENHSVCTDLCPRKVPIFEALSHEEIVKIATMAKHKRYQKGQVLIREGEISSTLYIVSKGQIKLSKMLAQGKEQILRILTTGDFFGEFHLFNSDEVMNFSAHAMKESDICIITKQDMDCIIEANPEITVKLLQAITKRLAHTEKLVEQLATKDPEIRIAQMIIEFCEKYGETDKEGIHIHLPLTREEMANYVGVTRETMSRKLSKFEDLGLISFIGNKELVVKNESAFQEMK
ncbi:Crp/Fnr family transcriptional regulator [Ectobacillus polymachus]|uniref:Crp/Fnr family transcriptional regulator n=1 Tax=Ectobacillus polymachus TaxID=1508806 RepID=UPI003A8B57A2